MTTAPCVKATMELRRYHFRSWTEDQTERVVRMVWAALPQKWTTGDDPYHRRWFAFCDRIGLECWAVARAKKHLHRIGAIRRTGHRSWEKVGLPYDPLAFWGPKVVVFECPESLEEARLGA